MGKLTDWLDAHLVADWRQSWRWISIQIAGFGGIVATAIATNTDVILTLIPMLAGSGWLQWIIITVTILVILARLWKQRSADNGDEA